MTHYCSFRLTHICLDLHEEIKHLAHYPIYSKHNSQRIDSIIFSYKEAAK